MRQPVFGFLRKHLATANYDMKRIAEENAVMLPLNADIGYEAYNSAKCKAMFTNTAFRDAR